MHHDLRAPLLAAAAWGAGLAAYLIGPDAWWLLPLLVGVAAFGAWACRRNGRVEGGRWLVAALLVAAAVVTCTLVRQSAVAHSPLRELATEGAIGTVEATVVSDPRPVDGVWADQFAVRLRVDQVSARGRVQAVGGVVLALGSEEWAGLALGATVQARGRLAVPDDPDLAALLTGAEAPQLLAQPDIWWRGSNAMRAAIRDAVAHRPPSQRALVPALVDGDDAGLPAVLEQQFRDVGLTHLTAVSGTNLTLLVGFLLLIGRRLGVRGRWARVIGVLGIVGFILLARTEPSVLRAAAMGAVGLFALGTDGRRRGMRALGCAVVGLLLISPALAVSVGFALSVLATAGIVLLVPSFQRGMAGWVPAPLAQAIAVPLAAQIACTPVIAGISGQVSLVAVVANLLAGPVVGPATILGLGAGLAGLVWAPVGRVFGTLASWCVAWIIEVAHRCAALPGAAIGWGTGAVALCLLTVLCAALIWCLPTLLRHPAVTGVTAGLALVVLLAAAVVGRIGAGPPQGWVMTMCDVGQGDGLVVRTGPESAIVVDTGPDPAAMDHCLDRLDVETVPILVLTHFHADHVDGLSGVLDGREVGEIETTGVLDPPAAVQEVTTLATDAGVPMSPVQFGATRQVGAATVQVLWPELPEPVPGAGDGSSANDASVVLLVETAGLRILLTGDVEPNGQSRVAATLGEVDIDVLKVPHHGSRYQDLGWLCSLRAEQALISVGADNDYGHPADVTVEGLQRCGATVHRTDTEGDLLVVPRGGAAVVE